VARRAGMSQSKLSKLETGALLPSPEDIRLICRVLKVPIRAQEKLLDQLRLVRTEYSSWRVGHSHGYAARQIDVAEREKKARRLLEFQACAVPGLLQVPPYAHRVMALANVTGQTDFDDAVAERVRRQQILYDPSREFVFVITETALLSRFCEPEVMLQQVQFIRAFSKIPHIRIGLVPASARLPNIPQNGFAVYDLDVVVIETFGGMITITDDRDIALYVNLFEQFSGAALYGDATEDFLESCMQQLRQWSGGD